MKKFYVILALVVLFGAISFIVIDDPGNTAIKDNALGDDQKSTTQIDDITKEMVASHSSNTDCWTIINGQVYDLTKYIPSHPGGGAIVSACGTDGTTLFTTRTTAEGQVIGSGTEYSSNAQAQLKQFKIGQLVE